MPADAVAVSVALWAAGSTGAGAPWTWVTSTSCSTAWVLDVPSWKTSETKIATWSPAASRPPTARWGSSWTLISCSPVGHLDGAGRLQGVRLNEAGREQLLPGEQVDGRSPHR